MDVHVWSELVGHHNSLQNMQALQLSRWSSTGREGVQARRLGLASRPLAVRSSGARGRVAASKVRQGAARTRRSAAARRSDGAPTPGGAAAAHTLLSLSAIVHCVLPVCCHALCILSYCVFPPFQEPPQESEQPAAAKPPVVVEYGLEDLPSDEEVLVRAGKQRNAWRACSSEEHAHA